MNREENLIAETMITLAAARGNTKTICPSEVARKLWPDDWQKHMPGVREAAVVLRNEGRIRIMQNGKEIFGEEMKGLIRIQIK